MMRKALAILLCIVVGAATAQEREVRGKVTYIAAGAVYTSLGRDEGIQDSTLLSVLLNEDTVAVIKVFAVSTRSSAGRVVFAIREPRIGDNIVGKVVVESISKEESEREKVDSIHSSSKPTAAVLAKSDTQSEFINIRGRVGAQYFMSLYSNPDFNLRQAGIVMNVRGGLTQVPLRFDLYANLRTMSLGRRSPFSTGSRNQSRIYGFAASYDDTSTVVSLGRIIPGFAPSIGYIDGALFSQRAGEFTFGTSFGFQPGFSLRGISSDYKKIAFFAQYNPAAAGTISLAYARTYFRSAIDREATSILGNLVVSSTFFVYFNSEFDLRKKSGSDFILSPRLTNLYVNLNYRAIRNLSIGVGVDASRPYYNFETIRSVPDSLLVNGLRSGITLSLNWMLPGGMTLYNTYNPRTSEDGFGREYSNYSSFNFNNLLSSGVNLRTHLNLNVSRYTKTTGYGISVQRTIERLVDVTLRFNRSNFRISQSGLKNSSTTLGADILVFLSRSLSLLATYDRLDGYGSVSNAVFTELSVRF